MHAFVILGGARPRSSRPSTSSKGVSTKTIRIHGNTDGHDESYEVLTSPNNQDDTLQQSMNVKLSMMDSSKTSNQNIMSIDRGVRPNGLRSRKIRFVIIDM